MEYKTQYRIAFSTYLTFYHKNRYCKKLNGVKHKEKTYEKYKERFPFKKFMNKSEKFFRILSIYIMYKHKPTSFDEFIYHLREYDDDALKLFIDKLKNMYDYFEKDLYYLLNKYGYYDLKSVYDEYVKGNIKFYTLYFLSKFYLDKNKIYSNIVYKMIYRQCRCAMVYFGYSIDRINQIVEKVFGKV